MVTPAILPVPVTAVTFLAASHIRFQISRASQILHEALKGSGFVLFVDDSEAMILPLLSNAQSASIEVKAQPGVGADDITVSVNSERAPAPRALAQALSSIAQQPDEANTITRTLFECGLVVHVAKIATYLDQVVDAFYVTNAKGQKIHSQPQLAEIRQRLTAALERPPVG